MTISAIIFRFNYRAISQRNGLYICTHLLLKIDLCCNRIQIIFCMYVEISVDNIINIQILISVFLYFNFSDRNGLYAKTDITFCHRYSTLHEALEIIFFTGYVISSVVNMTSEKFNVSEVSIFLRSKMKKHWMRNGLYVTDCMDMSKWSFKTFFYLQLSNISEYKLK